MHREGDWWNTDGTRAATSGGGWSRRRFLGTGLAGAAGLTLLSCGGDRGGRGAAGAAPWPDLVPPGNRDPGSASGPATELTRVAEPGQVEIGGRRYDTWLYDGAYPGPEIRVREGERLRVTVENRLPEGTTIHWHGIPVPNPMDGVPGVTQQPIEPGGRFVYEYEAGPAGTYMYHSHVGLQLDRALLGPLVVEEATPHVEYDRDYLVVFDDWLAGPPRPLEEIGGGGMGRGMMGGRGRMDGGMMGGQVPPYEALLVNGRPSSDPPVFDVRRGERVRLRLVNPSSAATFRVAVAGHRLLVTHTDGRPVEPHPVDRLTISMGERYDVLVEADNPGLWNLLAAPVEVTGTPARAVLRYLDAAGSTLPPEQVPEGLEGGAELVLGDLRSLELEGPSPRPDRTLDLVLSGGMMSSAWTIDGQAWPDAPPLEVLAGERVRVEMENHSPMLHPMHLHGHFFRVADVLKDTVLVPSHMTRVAFEFQADHPGDWFFHCHNLYHLEAGMARVVSYV